MLVSTNKEYKKTLAQQEDLNWDGDPDLDLAAPLRANEVSDIEYECAEEKDLAASLRANKVSLNEYIVRWFYD